MKQLKHLLLLTLLSLCSVTSQAYEVTVNMITYKTDSGDTTAYVSGHTSGITEAKIRSSITYNGKQIPVTSIGSSAFLWCGLTSVTIPNSVTSIGDHAFYDCSRLTRVTIPNSVTSIGEGAFLWCESLTNVAIGNSVTSIGSSAFACCKSLTSVTIPNSVTSIGSYAFDACSRLTSVAIGNSVTSIGYRTFEDCTNLTSVTIPNSVTSIGSSAFKGCTSLTSVEYNAVDCKGPSSSDYAWFKGCPLTTLKLGDNVETIPAYLVYNQNSITGDLTIPNSVTYIGQYAFYKCFSITGDLIIPNSVTSIGSYAFEGCTNLTSVTIPNSVTYIGDRAFLRCSRLTSVAIGNSVTYIGDWAFCDCSGLTSVTIPNSVTKIGDEAFLNCSKLTSIEYNAVDCKGPSEYDLAWFNGCPLTSLKIGNEVKSIPSYLAYDQSKLTSVTIPNSATSIGKSAFAYCGLKSIYAKSKQPIALENEIFDGNAYNNAILYVPRGCVDIYKQYMFWDEFNTILEFNDDITGDADGNGVVDISDANVLINVILAKDEASKYDGRADVTGDGVVDISDVNEIINIILGKN